MTLFITPERASQAVRERYGMAPEMKIESVYAGSGNILIIENESAVETAERILAENKPDENGALARIYFAEGEENEGVYMLNAVYGEGRNGSFYPETLFRHPFRETSRRADKYLKLTKFFSHHKIFFFEIAAGDNENIYKNVSLILDWLEKILCFKTPPRGLAFNAEEETVIGEAAAKLQLTAAMRNEFYVLMRKYINRGGGADVLKSVRNDRAAGRKEAKALYETLRKRLME